MSTQTLEIQQVPELRGLNERVTTVETKVEQNVSAIAETQAKAEIARQAAIKAADAAADAQVAAEHADHMATEAVEQATRANEVAEEANKNIVAATEELNASVDKIEGLEQRVEEGEGQIVEFREELDAMQSASDVVDIVDTYAQLLAYDTSKIHDNDVIKVLQDEAHDGAIAYYRFSSNSGPSQKDILSEYTDSLYPYNLSYDKTSGLITISNQTIAASAWYRLLEPNTAYTFKATLVDSEPVDNALSVSGHFTTEGMDRGGFTQKMIFSDGAYIYDFTTPSSFEYDDIEFRLQSSGPVSIKVKVELLAEVSDSPWKYIGSVGPYYTKGEIDQMIGSAITALEAI